jgi:photosystem II stability/assembly factor-like uncharacterized protein
MRRIAVTFSVCAVILLALPMDRAVCQEIWAGKYGNIKNVETRAVIIDNGGAYMATRTGLYSIRDISQGDKWDEIFTLPPGGNEISSLGARGRNILIGTKRGLFRSDDGGRSWRNVFRTIIPEKNNILSVDISKYDPKKVVICTMKGVFLSPDGGSGWTDISANLKNKRLACAALNKDVIYAAGDDGLYAMKAGQSSWSRIYVNSAVQADAPASDEAGDSADYEDAAQHVINCVTVKGSRLYLGVNRTIVYSDDEGLSWKPLPKYGLAGTVNYILPAKKSAKIYCATGKGVFEYDDGKGRWTELYKGMDKTLSVASLVFSGEDEKTMWAVTERGLYRIEAGRYSTDQYIDIERNLKSFKIAYDNEPTFKELQQAAVKYCDVSPEKIKNWQRDSKLRALLPKVSCGFDNHLSSNQSIYTSATRDYVTAGPDDYYKALDVSVSWDVSGLIWNDSQANIDVRSRLTTQLRNDILDDLRRAYYERKRLQFDMTVSPPKDLKSRFEKELRIQELTQEIDDLTGNYLSDNTKNKANQS